MPVNKTIGVIGAEESDNVLAVLAALAGSCGLSVCRTNAHAGSDVAGFILLGTPGQQAAVAAANDRPSIRVIMTADSSAAARVRFSAAPAAPWPFCGRTLETGSAAPVDLSDLSATVVATADDKPVWTTSSLQGMRHDTCWVSLPWVEKGDCVFTQLNAQRFIGLLPLIEWMRSLSGTQAPERHPLRACFMFDDPNLHASRYGFAKFDQLAEEGRRDHYHTAFATVPLDGYYVDRAAAQIFRDNAGTLSLLVHGNNHTYRELAGRPPARERLAHMRQAMDRITRLEQEAGFAVSRVMAPPHGVCSAEMMESMMQAGFEAVCVSHGSVRTGNPDAEWTIALGAHPSTVVSGLPVIPRFGLDRNLENNALLAAYLRQPVVPMGHHWDLADGTEILSKAAGFINGIGRVAWSNMTVIARNNYVSTVEGHVMRVSAYSRRNTIDIPAGVAELDVELPWMDPLKETVEARGPDGTALPLTRDLPAPALHLDVTPGGHVDLVVTRKPGEAEQPQSLPGTPLGVIARKVLVELRDRSMPHFPRNWVRK